MARGEAYFFANPDIAATLDKFPHGRDGYGSKRCIGYFVDFLKDVMQGLALGRRIRC
jgi:hypothetical protein